MVYCGITFNVLSVFTWHRTLYLSLHTAFLIALISFQFSTLDLISIMLLAGKHEGYYGEAELET